MHSLVGNIEPKSVPELANKPHSGNGVCTDRSVFAQRGQASIAPYTPTLTMQQAQTPVTHLLASTPLVFGDKIKEQVYECKNPVDLPFLNSIDAICAFFEYALENSLVAEPEVDKVISMKPLARYKQVKACSKLIRKALARLIDTKRNTALLMPLVDYLEPDEGNTFLQNNDWELDFQLACEMYVESSDDDIPLDGLHLICQSYGLVNLSIDLIELDVCEQLKLCIMQFVYFCARLSGHVTTLDLFTDEYIQYMLTGVDDCLFDGMSDEEQDEYDLDAINAFISVKLDCKHWSSRLEATPSINNIKTFHRKLLGADSIVPDWLIQATDILIKGIVEKADIYDDTVMEYCSLPFEYSRSISLGFEYESDVLSNIHESIAYNEELNLLLKLKSGTSTVLTNVDLAEKLLMFINEKLFTMTNKEETNG